MLYKRPWNQFYGTNKKCYQSGLRIQASFRGEGWRDTVEWNEKTKLEITHWGHYRAVITKRVTAKKHSEGKQWSFPAIRAEVAAPALSKPGTASTHLACWGLAWSVGRASGSSHGRHISLRTCNSKATLPELQVDVTVLHSSTVQLNPGCKTCLRNG